MYPIYIRNSQDFGLSADDISGVQHLYSAPVPRMSESPCCYLLLSPHDCICFPLFLDILSSFNVSGLEEKTAKVHRKLQKHIKAGRRKKPKQTEEDNSW